MGCSPEDLPEAMIGKGGERGSGISVLVVRHDDDDDDDVYLFRCVRLFISLHQLPRRIHHRLFMMLNPRVKSYTMTVEMLT